MENRPPQCQVKKKDTNQEKLERSQMHKIIGLRLHNNELWIIFHLNKSFAALFLR